MQGERLGFDGRRSRCREEGEREEEELSGELHSIGLCSSRFAVLVLLICEVYRS